LIRHGVLNYADRLLEMFGLTNATPTRRRPSLPPAAVIGAVFLLCTVVGGFARARSEEGAAPTQARQMWTCRYIATTPDGPLQITAKFEVLGEELAEVETIPSALNFKERYKILENNETDIVAAISIAKIGKTLPPGIGAVVIIIAKQNGLFQQSGAILGVRIGAPTLGHCERQ
jgi:hypothetical protein